MKNWGLHRVYGNPHILVTTISERMPSLGRCCILPALLLTNYSDTTSVPFRFQTLHRVLSVNAAVQHNYTQCCLLLYPENV